MKVALLTFNQAVYESSFAGVAGLLLRNGHEIHTFYHPSDGLPANGGVVHHPCQWWNFELGALEALDPDRVLVFNGSFAWCHAATAVIRERWDTLYAELGWLPQSNQIYIDPRGPGARSQLFLDAVPTQTSSAMESLRELYKPSGASIEPGFILVPLQMEADTSILYDSPVFKTMHSLVGFVVRSFPDHRIVVKTHPRIDVPFEYPGVLSISNTESLNDLVVASRAVVGINSTSLIEALVHHKPVMALGSNVISGKNVFYEGSEALKDPRGLLSYVPDVAKIDQCLTYLKSLQFLASDPPSSVVGSIERGTV